MVNYYAPAKVFKFLIDSSGAIALLVCHMIVPCFHNCGCAKSFRRKAVRYVSECVALSIPDVFGCGDRLYHLRAGGDAVPSGAAAGGDLYYRPVSSAGIICTVPIMSRWKKLVLWQKLPLQNTR
ncbi:hypothetical protein MJ588_06025 [Klebsiella pneumoniae]|nr:hypothetical protein MJ588_06025 [Klebsiella pneumoniae]